jgi:hypothetical protein
MSTRPDIKAAAVLLATASREAQGLPALVDDPDVLLRVAAAIRPQAVRDAA